MGKNPHKVKHGTLRMLFIVPSWLFLSAETALPSTFSHSVELCLYSTSNSWSQMENIRQEGDVAVCIQLLPSKYSYLFTCIDVEQSSDSNNWRYFKIHIYAKQTIHCNMINFYLTFCLLLSQFTYSCFKNCLNLVFLESVTTLKGGGWIAASNRKT